MTDPPIRIAFVCVQNAGRSQMATAFAEHERDTRDLTDDIDIITGGTHPADDIHPKVINVMHDAGYDLTDRTPQPISTTELERCDYIATMGCSTLEIDADVDIRDWTLDDPHGRDRETVETIRDNVQAHVTALFDEIEAANPTRD